MKQVYDQAWRGIINPTKYTHQMPTICPKLQNINGDILQRIDLSFKNKRGNLLSIVIFKQYRWNPQHVILYLHGNGGSKLEALGFLPLLCANRTAIISFDFVGCGNSEEGYLTYGINQSKDAQQVIFQSKKYFPIQKLIVWGRSMGAVTSILFSQRNRDLIEAMILDCPFQKLQNSETYILSSLSPIFLYFISKQINSKLGMEIFGINYLDRYRNSCKNIPTLFFYSLKDRLVPKQQVIKFYRQCRINKGLMEIKESHQEERSIDVLQAGIKWVRGLKKKKVRKLSLCYDSIEMDDQDYKGRTKSKGFCCQ